MEFNTKQELYNYLNNFDFESIKDNELSSVFFLVEFDGHVEPIYFTPFEGVWFESPCNLFKIQLKDNEIEHYVKNLYYSGYWDIGYEYEKNMQRNGWHYEINCHQCFKFLPDKIKIVGVISDVECLDWLLNKSNNGNKE